MAGVTNLTELVEDMDIEPESENAAEFTCETCGKGLVYGGRGRHPRFCDEHKPGASKGSGTRAAGKAGSASVDAAVSTLSDAYGAIGMIFMLFGAGESASMMEATIPGLNARNREFLARDPDLVKRINKIGTAGGRYAFLASQVLTLGPILYMGAREIASGIGNRSVTDDE